MNPVTIKMWDVGCDKWSGEVEAPSMRERDVTEAVYETVKPHLISEVIKSEGIAVTLPSDDRDGMIHASRRIAGWWNFA
jgi:hypothetical protein